MLRWGEKLEYSPVKEIFSNPIVMQLLLQAVAITITAALLPKLTITGFLGPVGMVVALTIINAKLWDAALFFSIPDSLTYQSLTLLATNGFIFWLLVKILPGIEISGVLPALVAPIVFTITSVLITKYAATTDWNALWVIIEGVASELKAYVTGNQGSQEKSSLLAPLFFS